MQCPLNNNTLYQADFSKSFLLLCGRDYNSNAGSEDLFNQPKATMGECIQTCANNTGCAGAGWGNYQGTMTCWLKSTLGQSNKSPNWYFAIKESGAV